jgi:hypothetical protein
VAPPAPRRQLVAKITAAHAQPDRYDALVVTGCPGQPDHLWHNDEASRLIRAFLDQGKPVAVAAAGSWSLIETGVLPARVEADLRHPGGDHRASGTGPRGGSLESFCQALVAAIAGPPSSPTRVDRVP